MRIPKKVDPTRERAVEKQWALKAISVYFFLALGSAKG
jgi:hypothetical protein